MIAVYNAEITRREALEEQSDEESESDDDVLGQEPPLPENWTVQRYDATNWADGDQVENAIGYLPEKEANTVIKYNKWRVKKEALDQLVGSVALPVSKSEVTPSSEPSSISTGVRQGQVDDWKTIKQLIGKHEFTCFGFAVYKTWGYDEESKDLWDRFWSAWRTHFDQVVTEADRQSSLREDDLKHKLKWHVVDDVSLGNADTETIRQHFETLSNGNDLELGIEHDLALVPWKDTARQFVNDPQGRRLFSVMAVDVYGSGQHDKDHLKALEQNLRERHGAVELPAVTCDFYPGYLYIRLDALIPDAWIFTQDNDPGEMYRGSTGTWTGPGTTSMPDKTGMKGFLTKQFGVGGDIKYRFD